MLVLYQSYYVLPSYHIPYYTTPECRINPFVWSLDPLLKLPSPEPVRPVHPKTEHNPARHSHFFAKERLGICIYIYIPYIYI